jgi:hypothetical protein
MQRAGGLFREKIVIDFEILRKFGIFIYKKKFKCMEKTIKETRGTVGERQMAFVSALKALDEDKELKPIYERMEREYEKALRDIAETVLDMEFDENNEPILNDE